MRHAYFDNAKAILIFLVVFGHFVGYSLYAYPNELTQNIYWFYTSFHMPAFIFIIGYFTKKKDWFSTFKQVINRFFIPYLVFQFLYSYANHIWLGSSLDIVVWKPVWLLWFLVSMMIWTVAMQIVLHVRWAWVGAIILFFAHRFFIPDLDVWALGMTITYFPYLMLGYAVSQLLRKYPNIFRIWEDKRLLLSTFLPIVGLIGFVVMYQLQANDIITISVAWLTAKVSFIGHPFGALHLMGYQLYTFLISCLMMLFFFCCVPVKNMSWSVIGRTTFTIYLLHGFVRQWFVKEGLILPLDSWTSVFVTLAYTLVVVYVLHLPIFQKPIQMLEGVKAKVPNADQMTTKSEA